MACPIGAAVQTPTARRQGDRTDGGKPTTRSEDWHEVDDHLRPAWRRVFNENPGVSDLAPACPLCTHPTLHRWYRLEKERPGVLGGVTYKGPGRLWEWCSRCRNFEYYPDGHVPEWWAPPFDVADELLRYDPGPLETARSAAGRPL